MSTDDPEKMNLTVAQKEKIKRNWFEYPLEVRKRYWKETDYGAHPDKISVGLAHTMKLDKNEPRR